MFTFFSLGGTNAVSHSISGNVILAKTVCVVMLRDPYTHTTFMSSYHFNPFLPGTCRDVTKPETTEIKRYQEHPVMDTAHGTYPPNEGSTLPADSIDANIPVHANDTNIAAPSFSGSARLGESRDENLVNQALARVAREKEMNVEVKSKEREAGPQQGGENHTDTSHVNFQESGEEVMPKRTQINASSSQKSQTLSFDPESSPDIEAKVKSLTCKL